MSELPKCPVCDGPVIDTYSDLPVDLTRAGLTCSTSPCPIKGIWFTEAAWRALPRRCEDAEQRVGELIGCAKTFNPKTDATQLAELANAVLACMVVPPSGAVDKGDLLSTAVALGGVVDKLCHAGSVLLAACPWPAATVAFKDAQDQLRDQIHQGVAALAKSPSAPLPPATGPNFLDQEEFGHPAPVPPLTPEDATDADLLPRMEHLLRIADDGRASINFSVGELRRVVAAIRARILPSPALDVDALLLMIKAKDLEIAELRNPAVPLTVAWDMCECGHGQSIHMNRSGQCIRVFCTCKKYVHKESPSPVVQPESQDVDLLIQTFEQAALDAGEPDGHKTGETISKEIAEYESAKAALRSALSRPTGGAK